MQTNHPHEQCRRGKHARQLHSLSGRTDKHKPVSTFKAPCEAHGEPMGTTQKRKPSLRSRKIRNSPVRTASRHGSDGAKPVDPDRSYLLKIATKQNKSCAARIREGP